jgi:DNA-binding CsgD family transcriptional regulator
VGEAWGEAQAQEYLGATLRDTGDLAGSRPRYEAALALRRGLGDARGVAQTLGSLANLALRQGDHDRATLLSEESLALAWELGDRTRVASSLFSLAEAAHATGDPSVASRYSEAQLAAATEGGDAWMVALASFRLAELARSAGDSAGAAAHYARCLHLCRQHGFRGGAALSLVGLAALALERGRPERAARRLGAAEALRAGTPFYLFELPREIARNERTSAAIQAALAAHPAAPSWLAAGRSLSFERAVEEALQEAAAEPETAGTELLTAGAEALTPREREVASLVARGHTNRQIAAHLVIAERTAMRHVENVMAKLGVHSRAEVAAWAAQQGLLAPGAG